MSPWYLPLLLLPVLLAAFAALWAWQRRSGHAAVVDVAWTLGLALCALTYASLASAGWPRRRALVGALAALWYGRLAWHLRARLRRDQGHDGRYEALQERHAHHWDRWLLGFYLAQAVFVALPSTAFLAAMLSSEPTWRALDAVAVGLLGVAFLGQASADRTLSRWKADPANRGRTCRAGLWRYSRHPNYFFESVAWAAWIVFALGTTTVWVPLLVWLVMVVLLTRVTGIPPSEARALESRGEDYRRYQRTTSAFLPRPPAPDRADDPTAEPRW